MRWLPVAAVFSLLIGGGPVAAQRFAGAFTLTAHTGETVDSATLAGTPYAVFFGFTHCPVVCPTTLADLSRVLADLGPARRDLRAFLVTIDPERDTPARMRDYLAAFDPGITALSGPLPEIQATARDFGIVVNRVSQGRDYSFDHSASVLLVDRDGMVAETVAAGEPAAEIRRKLLAVIGP